jgi:hypothetical protein
MNFNETARQHIPDDNNLQLEGNSLAVDVLVEFLYTLLFPGFEVLTAVVMNINAFWNVTPCGLLKFYGHFVGICRLHFQGRKISQGRNQRERKWQTDEAAFTMVSCLTYSSTQKMEATYSYETLVDFQRITRRFSQKMELFMK